MKKYFVAAFGAALFMGSLNVQAQAPATVAATTPTATVAGPLKLGYTNIDYLLRQMPESKEIENQLTIQRTQADNELKRMSKEFEDKYAAYEKGQGQMSEVIKKDREAELQSLQSRVQEFQTNAQKTLQDKYGQLVNPVIQKIQKNIDIVAKENGFTYVFNLDAGAGTTPILLFAPEDGNISDLVLKKMGVTPKPAAPVTAPATTPATAPKKN